MTEKTGENSPKDEDSPTNMDISKCAKLFFNHYLIASHTDSSRIHELLKQAMTDKIDDRELFMKGIDYSYYYGQED
jgi:cell filamentation protein